jgi:signal transduction histidine kinase
MRSIRNRLTIILVIGMSVLLIGAGALISSVLHARLQDEFDQVLWGKAKLLIALIEDEGDVIEFDFSDDIMPEFSRSDRPEYFQLWLRAETRIEKSSSLAEHELPRLPGLEPNPQFRNIELPHGRRGRLVQVAFIPKLEVPDDPDEQASDGDGSQTAAQVDQHKQAQREEDEEDDTGALDPRRFPERAATLIVARDRTQLDALIHTLNLFLAGLMITLLVIMIVLVRLALRAGLRPLDDMRHQVSRLDVDSLTTGIQLHTETAELMPVVKQMNALLHRLDAAFRRERQFSSDVAHELRTPLAELRVLTEVGGRWPDDREAVEQYFADAHGICEQMERVVISLLTLTRCERGVQPVQMTPIHLTKIVEAGWQGVKQIAKERSQRFECNIPASYTITSDYDMLLMVLSNLLGNAVVHSAPASVVRCVATQDGNQTCLMISNPVKALAAEDLQHMFERFWRKDMARSDGTHAGLGLSIVKAFSDLLNFNIQAHLEGEHTFTIRLSLEATQL